MSGSYGALAGRYDQLTRDVDYSGWADFLERLFARAGRPVRSVVELGCGTGSLTAELARRGYAMTGVDLSEDMLAEAADKCLELDPRPLLLRQDMSRLSLLERTDAVICCLDSLNYVTQPAAVRQTFRRVRRWLEPGGPFIFDIRTPAFLQAMDGQIWLDEDEDLLCLWRGDYSPRRRTLTYALDLFTAGPKGLWERATEVHREYVYQPDELAQWLSEAGFSSVRRFGELRLRSPRPDEERIFFFAR